MPVLTEFTQKRSILFMIVGIFCCIGVVLKVYFTTHYDIDRPPQFFDSMGYKTGNPLKKNEMSSKEDLIKFETQIDLKKLQDKLMDDPCPERKLGLMNSYVRKRTGMLSYPASGSSWTRHLVEHMSGVYTCDKPHPTLMGHDVRLSNTNAKVCITYKSHNSAPSVMSRLSDAIILIRNPLYMIKSFFHYRYGELDNKRNKHHIYANTSLFFSPKWTKHVASCVKGWKTQYMSWMKLFKGRSMILVYENMLKNLPKELLRLVRFLGLQVTQKEFWCTIRNKEGEHHRTPRNLTETSIDSIFTATQKKEILMAVCEVVMLAGKLNIDLDISQYFDELSNTPRTACL